MVITEIHIYDFDGTLFNSPLNTPENQQLYENSTGLPWTITKEKSLELSEKLGQKVNTRSGWWGRPETLEPPLVPDPAPINWFNLVVVEEFYKSKANPSVLTCIMTGRHVGLKKHVLRICYDGKLFTEEDNIPCYCLGDNGPDPQGEKPHNTLGWKIWMTKQLVRLNPEVQKLVFWEDREDHVPHFVNLAGDIVDLSLVYHFKSEFEDCII